MRLDPVLLNMACSWAMNAYKDQNKDAIKIESKWTSTTVYVAKRKSIDIIAFRGTQQGRDWLTDALVVPVPYADRLCHGGFAMAHRSVWKEVKKHIDPKKRTLICGHSLGGALAELSAAKMYKKHKNINLVTFGKPNTFFKGFKRPMDLDYQISCVQGSDIVSRIPRLCYGPSVSQTMLYFANNGTNVVNPGKLFKKVDRGGFKDRISDHMMAGYAERLEQYLEERKDAAKKVTDIRKQDKEDLEKIADELETS